MKAFKHNGHIAALCSPYKKNQHPNQKCGIDMYIDILDFQTGAVNTVKLYENSKGFHVKKNGTHYLKDLNLDCHIQPYEVKDIDGKVISRDSRLFKSIK